MNPATPGTVPSLLPPSPTSPIFPPTPGFIIPRPPAGLSGSSLLLVFGTNCVIVVIAVGLWYLLFNRWDVYATKPPIIDDSQGGFPDGDATLFQNTKTWLQIIWNWLFSTAKYRTIARGYGKETALYLLFGKILALCTAVAMFFAVCVVTPVNISGHGYVPPSGHKTEAEALEDTFYVKTTMTHVLSSPSHLYAHVAVLYCITVIFLLIWKKFLQIARNIDWEPFSQVVQNYAVRVTGLPRSLSAAQAPLLEQAIRTALPQDSIISLHIGWNIGLRMSLAKQLETCEKNLHAAASAAERTGGSGSWNKLTLDGWRPTFVDGKAYYTAQRNKLKQQIEMWEDRVRHSRTVIKCSGFAHVLLPSRALVGEICRNSGVVQIQPQDVRDLQASMNKDLRPAVGGPVNRVGYELDTKLEGILTDHIDLQLKPARNPQDIVWENVGTAITVRVVRQFIIYSIFIFGLIVCSTPAAIFSGLQNVVNRGPFHEFLQKIGGASRSAGAEILFQYVPSILLLVITVLLPTIIEFFTAQEKMTSRYAHKKRVYWRIYIYLVLSVFVLPALSLTALTAVLGKNLDEAADDIRGSFLAGDGSLFVNYLIQVLTLGCLSEFWRFFEFFVYIYRSAIFYLWDMPPEMKFDSQFEFEFAWQYPILFTIFVITLNFTIFTPLIAVVGFFYFFIKWSIQKRTLKTHLWNNLDTLDRQQITGVLRQLTIGFGVCLVLAQLLPTFYFAWREYLVHSVLLALLVALTVVAIFRLLHANLVLHNQFARRMMDSEQHIDNQTSQNPPSADGGSSSTANEQKGHLETLPLVSNACSPSVVCDDAHQHHHSTNPSDKTSAETIEISETQEQIHKSTSIPIAIPSAGLSGPAGHPSWLNAYATPHIQILLDNVEMQVTEPEGAAHCGLEELSDEEAPSNANSSTPLRGASVFTKGSYEFDDVEEFDKPNTK